MNVTNRNNAAYREIGNRISSAAFAAKKHRTISDDLRREELERERAREWEQRERDQSEPMFQRSWSSMGEGTGRRVPVCYE